MAIERIYISPARGTPQVERQRITVQTGLGPLGDRNLGVFDHPGQNLTLVEAEAIEAFCVRHGRPVDLSITRRNLVTRGIRLNDLVKVEFTIGSVKVRGVELCDPCSKLGNNLSSETLSPASVVRDWMDRGGLRVDVLSDGDILQGDRIRRGHHSRDLL